MANAEALAAALGGRKAGGGWIARCPAHDDREPSLSVRAADDGKVLVRCHAGCGQALVIAVLRTRGLWGNGACNPDGHARAAPARRDRQAEHKDTERTEAAMRVWRTAVPTSGTPVEFYLRSRGLVLRLPLSLRYHAGFKHPSGTRWPTMVALVTHGTNGAPLGVHRTFLSRDGAGKAPIVPQRMMLGPCRGGAVRLAPPSDVLMAGEGIETCLAAMQATGHPAWAALSTAGLRALELPAGVQEVIVLADGDDPGEAAACAAALRWKREGRRVRIARPPRGLDFNDVLLGRTSQDVGAVA